MTPCAKKMTPVAKKKMTPCAKKMTPVATKKIKDYIKTYW